MSPYYSTNAFYDALEKIDGYEEMRITEAAQRVQRSGFPEAYEDHADDGRALASALTGNSQGGQFTCEVDAKVAEAGTELDENGLTSRAADVLVALAGAFGAQSVGGFSPDGLSSGHLAGPAPSEVREVLVSFRP